MTVHDVVQGGSQSIDNPGYWWYVARERLLHAALSEFVAQPDYVLDVGSADGPSVGWLSAGRRKVTIDVDPEGLRAGEGICASALALPFADSTFDLVTGFDVVEHCEPEALAMAELTRVLRPGGRLLLSVPAYSWAWTSHDVRAGHYRRYTEERLVNTLTEAGLTVLRTTYAFSGVFPMFAAERLRRKYKDRKLQGPPPRGLPSVPGPVESGLLAVCRREEKLLRRRDLPFGSSVFAAARKGSA